MIQMQQLQSLACSVKSKTGLKGLIALSQKAALAALCNLGLGGLGREEQGAAMGSIMMYITFVWNPFLW